MHVVAQPVKPIRAAWPAGLLAGCLIGLSALSLPLQAAPGLPSTQVAWQPAATDADVDRAFAQARAENRPVLLYWGATWCPPCNQLKATLFNRQDFAAQSRSLVAVHVDGDRPGAQKLGAAFQVRGYPTLILMRPDRSEITRLPGEAEAAQVMALLQTAMAGGRPAAEVLADARAGRPLTAGEWKLLAFHGWETDESKLVPAAERPAVLAALHRAAARAATADEETRTRLMLKALALGAEGANGLAADAAVRTRTQQLLADASAARAQMDVLVYNTPALVRALAGDDDTRRAALTAAFDTALQRLQADTTLSRADRISALDARVSLARHGQADEVVSPRLPPALLAEVRGLANRLDQETRDPFERQAVVPSLAWVQARAGLWADSDALLQANLARSAAPYYLMSQLGSNARKQGRPDEALRWYAQAFERSEGPATRLQWGAGYLAALVDLAAGDVARIEQVAGQIFTEAGRDPAAFHERSARSLQRAAQKLAGWGAQRPAAEAALQRLQTRLAGLCAAREAADGQRQACEATARSLVPGGRA
ncbi:thioredoxin fold domain-containing protein [Aquincola tertiaricarbonis]|uniref:thioredoxin fold domain-containing protein n=1 Tax=Aquincola tertiaricarbonis TaxID=391953 RepID=UPI0009F9039F|nr:thioredoxin family protein [Aquincola tertiaricarbonis]